jgi:5-hydroxyisourate hydrolase-like protein (transthyretin family)
MKVKWVIACFIAVTMFSASSVMAQIVPAPPLQTGSVTGIVRTATGVPAVGVRVTAMRTDAMDDALRAMVSLTQTDSTGRYHLENVPAGRYYIAAGRVDLPTFYPGTLDMTQGTAVSISSAAPLSDIDFVIQDTSAAIPAGRGARGQRAGRGVQIVPPNPPSPVNQNRGRGARATPVLPQLNVVVPPPNQSLVAIRRNPVGQNLVSIAAQPSAAWWTNAALVARLGLTPDQMRKVEATFDQHRQAIVQNTTELAREEAALARLLETEPLESTKTVTAQIDRVIRARGELERTNSTMTMEMRQSLTRSQWIQLQMETQHGVQVVSPTIGLQRILPPPAAPR